MCRVPLWEELIGCGFLNWGNYFLTIDIPLYGLSFEQSQETVGTLPYPDNTEPLLCKLS